MKADFTRPNAGMDTKQQRCSSVLVEKQNGAAPLYSVQQRICNKGPRNSAWRYGNLNTCMCVHKSQFPTSGSNKCRREEPARSTCIAGIWLLLQLSGNQMLIKSQEARPIPGLCRNIHLPLDICIPESHNTLWLRLTFNVVKFIFSKGRRMCLCPF